TSERSFFKRLPKVPLLLGHLHSLRTASCAHPLFILFADGSASLFCEASRTSSYARHALNARMRSWVRSRVREREQKTTRLSSSKRSQRAPRAAVCSARAEREALLARARR